MILTSLASVAVAAMFGMCMALCRSDFPHFERRENPLFPPLLPLSPPFHGGEGWGGGERGGDGGCGGRAKSWPKNANLWVDRHDLVDFLRSPLGTVILVDFLRSPLGTVMEGLFK